MFKEKDLELLFIESLTKTGFTFLSGDSVHKEISEVIIIEDLNEYLFKTYRNQDITNEEISMITRNILSLKKMDLYEANKKFSTYITEGFQFKRKNKHKKDIWINLIDFNKKSN